MGKGLDMSFFYGFMDELTKVASEPAGEYPGPMTAGAATGFIIGGMTGQKGKRLRDALILGLTGSGFGAGREYWLRRKAEKTASAPAVINSKKSLQSELEILAGLGGLGGTLWGLVMGPGGLGNKLKSAGKFGLASAIASPLGMAIINRKEIRNILKEGK